MPTTNSYGKHENVCRGQKNPSKISPKINEGKMTKQIRRQKYDKKLKIPQLMQRIRKDKQKANGYK